jgi:hypothetical protein
MATAKAAGAGVAGATNLGGRKPVRSCGVITCPRWDPPGTSDAAIALGIPAQSMRLQAVPHVGRVHHAPGAAWPAPRHGPRVAAPCGAICELGRAADRTRAPARPYPPPTGLGCQSLIAGNFAMRSLQPAEWNFVIALALLAVLAFAVVLMLPDFTGR